MFPSKKSTIMHYKTALNASKKKNDTNYRFKVFYAWAVIVMLQSAKNHFAGIALFLAGDKFRYFLDRPYISKFTIQPIMKKGCTFLF